MESDAALAGDRDLILVVWRSHTVAQLKVPLVQIERRPLVCGRGRQPSGAAGGCGCGAH